MTSSGKGFFNGGKGSGKRVWVTEHDPLTGLRHRRTIATASLRARMPKRTSLSSFLTNNTEMKKPGGGRPLGEAGPGADGHGQALAVSEIGQEVWPAAASSCKRFSSSACSFALWVWASFSSCEESGAMGAGPVAKALCSCSTMDFRMVPDDTTSGGLSTPLLWPCWSVENKTPLRRPTQGRLPETLSATRNAGGR